MANLDDSPIRDEPSDEPSYEPNDATCVVAVLSYSDQHAEAMADVLGKGGADVYVTANWAMCLAADGLIVPSFDSPSNLPDALKSVRAAEMIDARLLANRSVLVVGNAFNVLFESRDLENPNAEALQQWPGYSENLTAGSVSGWIHVEAAPQSRLFHSLELEEFFFDNAMAVFDWRLDAQGPLHAPKVSWSQAEPKFLAAVENGPLVATQFRPELSGAAGQRFLQNWVMSL